MRLITSNGAWVIDTRWQGQLEVLLVCLDEDAFIVNGGSWCLDQKPCGRAPIKQAKRSAIGGGRTGSWCRQRWRLDIEADRVRKESVKRTSLAGSPKPTGRTTYNDTTKRVILVGGWVHRRKGYAGGDRWVEKNFMEAETWQSECR